MFHVYIIYSEKLDLFYVGSTANLIDRINRHNNGRSKYTKKGIPWHIVYSMKYESRSDAYNAELYIEFTE